MKHRKLFGIALLFPYLLWGICALLVYPLSSQEASDGLNFIPLPIIFYVAGIALWFIPYTLLAIGMWFWSKNKSVASLRKLGLSAPIVFSGLMSIEYSILIFSNNSPTTNWAATITILALLIFSSMVVGYLFVGIAMVVLNNLQSRKLIAEDE